MSSRTFTVLPAAEQDMTEAYDWYEGREFGLGSEFLRCVDACFNSIQRNPGLYQIEYETYRRAVVRRFPYVVFYEYNEQEIIIYAVFHCSQNPQKWRSRLQ